MPNMAASMTYFSGSKQDTERRMFDTPCHELCHGYMTPAMSCIKSNQSFIYHEDKWCFADIPF